MLGFFSYRGPFDFVALGWTLWFGPSLWDCCSWEPFRAAKTMQTFRILGSYILVLRPKTRGIRQNMVFGILMLCAPVLVAGRWFSGSCHIESVLGSACMTITAVVGCERRLALSGISQGTGQANKRRIESQVRSKASILHTPWAPSIQTIAVLGPKVCK